MLVRTRLHTAQADRSLAPFPSPPHQYQEVECKAVVHLRVAERTIRIGPNKIILSSTRGLAQRLELEPPAKNAAPHLQQESSDGTNTGQTGTNVGNESIGSTGVGGGSRGDWAGRSVAPDGGGSIGSRGRSVGGGSRGNRAGGGGGPVSPGVSAGGLGGRLGAVMKLVSGSSRKLWLNSYLTCKKWRSWSRRGPRQCTGSR